MAATGQMIITVGLLVLSHSTTLALPTNCVPGTYAGTLSCVGCLAGQYSSGSGMLYNACTNCLPGTYAPASGASACQYCPSGTYDATLGGATVCAACNSGLGLGLTACNGCFMDTSVNMNLSYVTDSNNHIARQLSLIDGSAPNITFSANAITYLFFSVTGLNLYSTSTSTCIFTVNMVTWASTLLAGSCSVSGYVDAPATSSRFTGLTNGAAGADLRTLYLLESYHIRTYDLVDTRVQTLIGSTGLSVCQAGPVPFANATLNRPYGIYASPSGNFLLVTDSANHVLYFVNLVHSTMSVIAGACNSPGSVDGPGSVARFNTPRDIKVVPDESFAVIADSGNNVFRKVILGSMTTLMNNPTSSAIVSTIIGTAGVSGNVDGLGAAVQLGTLYDIGMSQGGSLLYFPDWNKIKRADLSVSPVSVVTFSGTGVNGLEFGSSPQYRQPRGVAIFGCSVLCPANYYVIVGSTFCTQCPPNSVSTANSITCTANAGYYINGSTIGPISTGTCLQGPQCSSGTYVQTQCTALALAVCAPCQSGLTYSSSVDSAYCSPCTSICPVGTYFTTPCTVTSDTGCTQCPSGTYAGLSGQSVCNICPMGTYSANGASSCTMCQDGAYSLNGASACIVCPAGSYCPAYSSACTVCSPGSFSSGPASSCTACPSGTYSNNAGASTSSMCTLCTAGSYSISGATVCIVCQPGSYSGAVASSCNSCLAGTYSNIAGASTSSMCTLCKAGSYSILGATICTTCLPGSYSGTAAPSCTSCLVGTYSNIAGASTSSVCISCAVGSYSNAPASSTCAQCPTAFTTASPGASNPSQCNICNTGASSATGVCALCGTGTYSASTGATACINCSSNAFSTVSASACQTCAAGNYLYSYTVSAPTAPQNAGTVSAITDAAVPVSVGVGQYCSNYIPGTFISGDQLVCGNPYYCPWITSGGCWTVLSSRGATLGFTCDAGCYTASPCTGVANGILTTAGNNYDPNSCQIQCNPGYKLQNRACVLIGNCDLCPNGTYSPVGSTRCTTCSNGTFANSPGSTACSTCVSCNDGYYPANCGLSIGVCTQCPVGYYSKAGATVCTACQLGTYSTVLGANSSSVCTLCAIGAYASAPASVCTLCPAGYTTVSTGTPSPSGCNTCIPGTSSVTGACGFCSMGTFTQTLNSTQCSNCTSGWYSDNGASVCQACQAGKYFFSVAVAAPAAPVPAATASYLQTFSPVTLVAGQYCSNYNTEYMYSTYDYTTTYCNDLMDPSYAFCPWKKGSGCVEIGYASWCTSQTTNCPYEYDCLAGCRTASPCTNAVDNSTYTGPGVNGNPNSCPFACNPGYMLVNGLCVLVGHCTNCTAGTYSSTGLTSCIQCSTGMFTTAAGSTSCSNNCINCANGFFVKDCGISQGVCTSCNNI